MTPYYHPEVTSNSIHKHGGVATTARPAGDYADVTESNPDQTAKTVNGLYRLRNSVASA